MSNIRTIAMCTAALTLATAALSGCAQATSTSSDCTETTTIGFSHPLSEASGVKAIKQFLTQYAEEDGCVTVLLDNTTANNLETQRATVESWVTQGVDSILLWPVDPAAFTGLQQEAQDKGIKWLTYLVTMEGQDGSVGFDSSYSGGLIADDLTSWLAENHPEGGVSAAVTTVTALPALSGRWDVPLAALDAAGIPVVGEQDCADQACGLQIAEDLLREHPDLRVFIGMNDDAALGAKKAFDNAGIDPDSVYIGGSDGTPEGLASVKAGGAFRVTSAFPIAELAQDIFDNSLAAIRGEGETETLTPAVLAKTGDDATIDDLIAQYGSKQ
ncbi:sugar ABC transporter substrate-binding protein [Herbiconiux sp. YIM B11900]|uniref:sugar ABC transporter substrate-binding protein n=1 Tax=Herbiconiux sp. YIM B11900 TaxID=3404131 RepID=UPI003F84BAF6